MCRNESVFPDQCGNVTVHPCCVGVLGSCILTSRENCSFQNGYYHPELVCACALIVISVMCISAVFKHNFISSYKSVIQVKGICCIL